MRKLLGYIPLDKGEDQFEVAKEFPVIKIEGEWFKLVDVWIPGVAATENKKCFKVDQAIDIVPGGLSVTEVCKHCGHIESKHIGIDKECPNVRENISTKFKK